ncbi:HD domain-containing protein [Paludisphaera mucosa]|uniref:HD domain-containing protein n=1 Tax=Paludisphaera mucosa TaxID=3030827 RepID=A0ABT6F6I3_9BACT|nr:HD domain-containing protein [Paludisphaera mucosa]MDG3003159.1 HD domain-containing protein [Paludisphaera mucosa]
MHDKYKKQFRVGAATLKLRRQIALEAARRLLDAFDVAKDDPIPLDRLEAATEADFYAAKRKAAAVLGHRVRPGDLPSDDEIREQLVVLQKQRAEDADEEESGDEAAPPEPADETPVPSLAEAIDRFAVYRLRLTPLEGVKQNPETHPEGDALYHSLQVFQHARDARPYDEEFLLAALLHDVGKAIDLRDHVAAAVDGLRGAVTERTLWLIAHHMDLVADRYRALGVKQRREIDESEFAEDLKLLRECDDAGRVPGVVVETLEEALAYIRGLESEEYLDA